MEKNYAVLLRCSLDHSYRNSSNKIKLEKQYEDALVALGCKNVTSKTQKKNGTTAFRMPDGVNMITEHVTGYIRRTVLSGTGRVASCYQLNPQYKTPYKVVNQYGKFFLIELHKAQLEYRLD